MPVTVVVVSSAAGARPSLQQVPVASKEVLQVTDEPATSISAEELQQFIAEELQDDHDEKVVNKKRRLKAKEKTELRSALAKVDRTTLRSAIVSKISTMVHINKIEERRMFWEHCQTCDDFNEACDHFVTEYIKFHKQCDTGSDKYAIFYLTYHEEVPTSTYMSTLRGRFTTSYNNSVTDDTWNTFVSTFIHVSFNEIQRVMTCQIASMEADHVPPTASHTDQEEDVALLRLGGWALFSCIQYRQNALKGKSKTNHTQEKLLLYKAELQILEALVDDQKVGLPTAITAQDRGYMTFPCPLMMTFVKNLNKQIKEYVNPPNYEKYGSKLFDVSC